MIFWAWILHSHSILRYFASILVVFRGCKWLLRWSMGLSSIDVWRCPDGWFRCPVAVSLLIFWCATIMKKMKEGVRILRWANLSQLRNVTVYLALSVHTFNQIGLCDRAWLLLSLLALHVCGNCLIALPYKRVKTTRNEASRWLFGSWAFPLRA